MRFGWDYQRSGFNEAGYLPRGSRIYWSAEIQDVYYTFGSGRLDQFKSVLQAKGYGVSNVSYNIVQGSFLVNGGTFKIALQLTVPVDFSNANDAFNDVSGTAWQIWGAQPANIQASVLNVPQLDTGGNAVYNQAPGAAPVEATNTCATKTGFEWVACGLGLDSTASHLGLGVGAGAAIAAVGLIVIGLIVLKK